MASWGEFERADPALAADVQAILTGRKHHTLATVRADGSPRVSGIEIELGDGEVAIGLMGGSVKAADLARDPRCAIHALSADPPDHRTATPEQMQTWQGDAKLAGIAVAVDPGPDAEPGSGRARLDLTEVVLTTIGNPPDHLLIRTWHPDRGTSRIERR
jgi:hypothetical protein